jgi:2-oxoglutarate ferredoxin oxidoreductase subunit delta
VQALPPPIYRTKRHPAPHPLHSSPTGSSTVKGRIEIDRERCKGCGLCTTVCPTQRIEISQELNATGYYPASFKEVDTTDAESIKCTGCAMCATMCPDIAIEVYREEKKGEPNSETKVD